MVDHEEIENEQWIDRYVMGSLTDAEHELFSEHFVNCPSCLDQLTVAEAFQRDLKIVAAQELSQSRAIGSLISLVFKSRLAGAGILAAAVLVLVLGASFINSQNSRKLAVTTVELHSSVRAAGQTPVELAFAGAESIILTQEVLLEPYQRFEVIVKNEAGVVYRDQDLVRDGRVSLHLPKKAFVHSGTYLLRLRIEDQPGSFVTMTEHNLAVTLD